MEYIETCNITDYLFLTRYKTFLTSTALMQRWNFIRKTVSKYIANKALTNLFFHLNFLKQYTNKNIAYGNGVKYAYINVHLVVSIQGIY